MTRYDGHDIRYLCIAVFVAAILPVTMHTLNFMYLVLQLPCIAVLPFCTRSFMHTPSLTASLIPLTVNLLVSVLIAVFLNWIKLPENRVVDIFCAYIGIQFLLCVVSDGFFAFTLRLKKDP